MSAALRSLAITPPPTTNTEVDKWKSICSQKDLRIYDLEIENAVLHARLVATCNSDRAPSLVLDGEADNSDSKLAELSKRYEHLQRLYADLSANYEKCQHQIKYALRKYDEAKHTIKQWKAYIDGKINQGFAKDAAGPPIERTVSDLEAASTAQETTPKTANRVSSDHVLEPRAELLSRSSSDLPSNPTPYASSAAKQSWTNEPDRQTKRVTSSQTTEGDESFSIESHMIKQEPSDDEPVVVSERITKRKRSNSALAMPPPRRVKRERLSPNDSGSVGRPQELRSDDYSSPVEDPHQLMRMGTSDLDAMTGSFHTPRKRGLVGLSRDRALSAEVIRPHPSLSMRSLSKNSSSLSDGDIADLSDRLYQEDTLLPISDLNQAPAFESIASATTPRQRPKITARPRDALRQVSPNVPAMVRSGRLRNDRSKDLADKAGYLAEDGDENSSQVTPKPVERDGATAKTDAGARLGAMLDSSASNKQTLQKRARIEPKPSTARKAQLKSTERSKVAAAPSPLESRAQRFQLPRGLEKAPPPVRPEEEPLRNKAVTALRLSDFKPNPKYADSEFAYADSVRGRDAKRGLQGDSTMFIDAARAGNLPRTSKTDDEVLEDYLGDHYAHYMQSYNEAKQRETLCKARAQEYANAHGKGRQAFQRNKSPPGFWRADMPTTQEALEDRRKAQEQEDEKVEERWREAQLKNGRWMFRDE